MKKFTIVLIAALIAATANAGTYSGGSGASGTPCQIANPDDLQYRSEHSVIRNGKAVSSGVDQCKLNAGKDSETKKMLLLK